MSHLIISDTHYHNFNQYAQLDKHGRNTRLLDTLRATGDGIKAMRATAGDTIIHCGDVFHVRGQISPTVLNPVLDLYRNLRNLGVKVYMISGNHDLETNDAQSLASTVTALRDVGVEVINEPKWFEIKGELWLFVPWFNDLKELRAIIKQPWAEEPEDAMARRNLVIHAPLNGVIKGLPDHGLTPDDFQGLGLSNVFVGHYHNHAAFKTSDGKTNVYSVGALTHQNWGDVESRAGYILYDWGRGTLEQHETSAPKFVKVPFDEIDTNPNVAENYVKVIDGVFEKPEDIAAVRNATILAGAKAVQVEGVVKRPAVTRGAAVRTGAPTIHTILGEYVERQYPGDAEVKRVALEILGEIYD